MNTFDAINEIRKDIENDKKLKRLMKEYRDMCLGLYVYKVVSTVSKVIIDSKKENTPRK